MQLTCLQANQPSMEISRINLNGSLGGFGLSSTNLLSEIKLLASSNSSFKVNIREREYSIESFDQSNHTDITSSFMQLMDHHGMEKLDYKTAAAEKKYKKKSHKSAIYAEVINSDESDGADDGNLINKVKSDTAAQKRKIYCETKYPPFISDEE